MGKFYYGIRLFFFFFLFCPVMVFADDRIRLDVGETKTVDLPYSVRSKASYGTWSCDVNGILEYVGTTYDVKVKVLAYTSYTCHLKYTYSYREDGWSYTETYILGIDAPIYDLSGKRLREPRKGINLIGGKKVLVK